MAQPNVAREPSMEEILASIRRIIENNDPVESIDNASYSAPLQRGPETIELTIDEDIAMMAPEAPLVQPAESVVAPRAPERMEQPAARPMSLADVAARVKAASERRAPAAPANDTDRQVQSAPVTVTAQEASEPVQTSAATQEPAPFVSQDFGAVSGEPAQAYHEQAYHQEEPVVDRYELIDHAPEPAAEALEVSNDVDLDPIERFAVQIGNEIASAVPVQLLSPVTEEKVSRSFEELADALGGSKRTLDEIAEEVLKPMLQEWLDDNLPTLVERLVREEIERVARGPRR
ncbi:MAG TPA: DUF2497 domain-containing protein [Ensifer sp.]|nr:DUF2497 domain-containing protein [Ensifer sp.]